jgi:hypothetical protein
MRRLIATLMALALLALAAPAGADDQEAAEALAQFAQIAGVLQGYSPRPEMWRGQLAPGEATLVTENLMTGNEYLILATGEQAVTDLNLELFDADFHPVDADFGDDNTPVVSVTPPANGTYYIRVTLVTATAPTAWYAMQVMYR